MNETEVVRYNNGFELRYRKIPFNTIFGRLVIDTGAGYESKKEYGIAHFVEHVVFSSSYTKNLANLGYVNAETSSTDTLYEADFLPEEIDLFLKETSKIGTKISENNKEVETEKQIVLAEIREAMSYGDNYANQILYNTLHKENPLSRLGSLSGLGPKENIRRFSFNEINSFLDRWYNRKNMTLYLVGQMPDGLEKKVEDYFGESDKDFRNFEYSQGPMIDDSINLSRKAKGGLTKISVGWVLPFKEGDEKNIHISEMTYHLIGLGDVQGGMHRELRQNGLIYSMGDLDDFGFGRRSYIMKISFRPSKQAEVEKIVRDNIKRLQRGNLDRNLFERQIKRKLFTIRSRLNYPIGNLEEMYLEKKQGMEVNKEIEVIRNLTYNDIQSAAQILDVEKSVTLVEKPILIKRIIEPILEKI